MAKPPRNRIIITRSRRSATLQHIRRGMVKTENMYANCKDACFPRQRCYPSHARSEILNPVATSFALCRSTMSRASAHCSTSAGTNKSLLGMNTFSLTVSASDNATKPTSRKELTRLQPVPHVPSLYRLPASMPSSTMCNRIYSRSVFLSNNLRSTGQWCICVSSHMDPSSLL
jgi:hypothetical protein